jgi:cytochrome P450
VVDFDVYDHSRADRLHEDIRLLRETMPVAFTPHAGGLWVLTRYEDILDILRRPDEFSSFPTTITRKIHDVARMIPIAHDPPEHTAYRRMMNPLFSPRRMRELEGQIRRTVAELLNEIGPKGRCEFMSEFAQPLPATVFILLMGWPLEDAPHFQRVARDFLMGKPGASEEESDQVRVAAIMAAFDYFREIIADRRANPRDDFTTYLINEKYDGERVLREDELLNMLLLLGIAGLHTVKSMLGYSMIYLANNPDKRAELVADPALISEAVEEILRREAPVWMSRRVCRDITVAGVEFKRDDQVLLAMTSANHDSAEFDHADELDWRRHPNRHLSFGAGPHRCIGSHLARIELGIVLEVLLEYMPGFEFDPDVPPVRHLSPGNGVLQLGLRYEPFTVDVANLPPSKLPRPSDWQAPETAIAT